MTFDPCMPEDAEFVDLDEGDIEAIISSRECVLEYIKSHIEEVFGEECDDYGPGCATCEAYKIIKDIEKGIQSWYNDLDSIRKGYIEKISVRVK